MQEKRLLFSNEIKGVSIDWTLGAVIAGHGRVPRRPPPHENQTQRMQRSAGALLPPPFCSLQFIDWLSAVSTISPWAFAPSA